MKLYAITMNGHIIQDYNGKEFQIYNDLNKTNDLAKRFEKSMTGYKIEVITLIKAQNEHLQIDEYSSEGEVMEEENLKELYVLLKNYHGDYGFLDSIYENKREAVDATIKRGVENNRIFNFKALSIPYIDDGGKDLILLSVNKLRTDEMPKFVAFNSLEKAKEVYDFFRFQEFDVTIEDINLIKSKNTNLSPLVEVVKNNEECVILKVKPNSRMDLIALGCFTGLEDMFRITKGKDQDCTVFLKDETSYSWSWGNSGHTIVSESMNKKGNLIQQCIQHDLAITVEEHLIARDKEELVEQDSIELLVNIANRSDFQQEPTR